MAKGIFIGIGGTGQRVAEALAYLAAAGVVRDDLPVILLDHDRKHGNRTQTARQVRSLAAIRTARGSEGGGLFRGSLTTANDETGTDESLSFSNLHRFRDLSHDGVAALANILFDENDWDMDFANGYLGKAHVGSLDVIRCLDEAWTEVEKEIKDVQDTHQGKPVPVVLCGSIFGGMGASSLPAIARWLRDPDRGDLTEKVRLHALMFGPYFTWRTSADEEDGAAGRPENAMGPDPKELFGAAHLALSHYVREGEDLPFDVQFLLGSEELAPTGKRVAPGGDAQFNHPHVVELAGAMAISAILESGDYSQENGWYHAGGMKAELPNDKGLHRLGWEDIPGVKQFDQLPFRRGLSNLLVASLLHLGWLLPELQEYEKKAARKPRWVRLVEGASRKKGALNSSDLVHLDAFFLRALEWAAEMRTWHGSVRLFDLGRWEGGLRELVQGSSGGVADREENLCHLPFLGIGPFKPGSRGAAVMGQILGRVRFSRIFDNPVDAYLGLLERCANRFYDQCLAEKGAEREDWL